MTKKQIKKLAYSSYTRNNLDGKKVNSIARLLKRSDLKEYIKTLKSMESGKKVIVLIPNMSLIKRNDLQKTFTNLFPRKKVLYEEDPSLILGVKVINNDLVYEFSLKNTLEDMGSFLENQYD
jgi:F0F1-type ATP synthase delta subunit